MYYITKRLEISAAHQLQLPYPSKCTQLHGHNWIITIYCKSKELNANGMVTDFTLIKEKIKEKLDHTILNESLPGINPTAENIAFWVCQQIEHGSRVDVQESEGNIATYEQD